MPDPIVIPTTSADSEISAIPTILPSTSESLVLPVSSGSNTPRIALVSPVQASAVNNPPNGISRSTSANTEQEAISFIDKMATPIPFPDNLRVLLYTWAGDDPYRKEAAKRIMSIAGKPGMHTLNLAGLGLTELPGQSYIWLNNVDHLILRNNLFTYSPLPLIAPNLKYLDLSDNKLLGITSLAVSEPMVNLSELRYLNLSGNDEISLNGINFSKMQRIRIVLFMKTNSSAISEILSVLPQNVQIFLSDNQISSAEVERFKQNNPAKNIAFNIRSSNSFMLILNSLYITNKNLQGKWSEFFYERLNADQQRSMLNFCERLTANNPLQVLPVKSSMATLLHNLATNNHFALSIIELENITKNTDSAINSIYDPRIIDTFILGKIIEKQYKTAPDVIAGIRYEFRNKKLQLWFDTNKSEIFRAYVASHPGASVPSETTLLAALYAHVSDRLHLHAGSSKTSIDSLISERLLMVSEAEIFVKLSENTEFTEYLSQSKSWEEYLKMQDPQQYNIYQNKISQEIGREPENAISIKKNNLLSITENFLARKRALSLLDKRWAEKPLNEPWDTPMVNELYNQPSARPYNKQQIVIQLQGDSVTFNAAQSLAAKHPESTIWAQIKADINAPMIEQFSFNGSQFIRSQIPWSGLTNEQTARIDVLGHIGPHGTKGRIAGYSANSLLAVLEPLIPKKHEGRFLINFVTCQLGQLGQFKDTFLGQFPNALASALNQLKITPDNVEIHFRIHDLKVEQTGRKVVFADSVWGPTDTRKFRFVWKREVSANNQNGSFVLEERILSTRDNNAITYSWNPINTTDLQDAASRVYPSGDPDALNSRAISAQPNQPQSSQTIESIKPISLEQSTQLDQLAVRSPTQLTQLAIASPNPEDAVREHFLNRKRISAAIEMYNRAAHAIASDAPDMAITGNTRQNNGIWQAELLNQDGVSTWRQIQASQAEVITQFKNIVSTEVNRLNDYVTRPIPDGASGHTAGRTASRALGAIGGTGVWIGGFMNAASSIAMLIQEKDSHASKTAQLQMVAALAQSKLNGIDDILRLTAWSSRIASNAAVAHGSDMLLLINKLSSGITKNLNPATQGFMKMLLNSSQNTVSGLATRVGNISTMINPVVMGANLGFAVLDFGMSAGNLVTATHGLSRDLAIMRLSMSSFNLLMTAGIITTMALGWATAAAALNVFSLLLLPVMIALPFYLSTVFVNGYKYESVVAQIDELLAATQNTGFHQKDGLYQINRSLPVWDINFKTGKINYGDVYISGLEGGSAHTMVGGFHSYTTPPSVVWDENRRLNIWKAYNFQNEQTFSLPLSAAPILLPCTPGYNLKASYGQTTSTRYTQQNSLQRIANYYNGERHSGEEKSREFFLYQYYTSEGPFSDSGITSLERYNDNTRLKVVLDDQDRHLIISQILDKKTRDAEPRYEITGGGGRCTLSLSQGNDLTINNSMESTEQWHFQIDQLTHTAFNYESDMLRLQASIDKLNIAIANSIYIPSSMGSGAGFVSQRESKAKDINNKAILEIELNRLKALHGRQERAIENFFSSIRFSREASYNQLNLGREKIKFNGNFQQPITLSLSIADGINLQIILNQTTGERQVQVLMREINLETLRQVKNYLISSQDRQTIAPNGFISLISYKDPYSPSAAGFMEISTILGGSKVEILQYDQIGGFEKYKILGLDSQTSSILVTHFSSMHKLQIIPTESGKHCYIGEFKALGNFHASFRSTSMSIGEIFAKQLRLEMLEYKTIPGVKHTMFDNFWELHTAKESTIEIPACLAETLTNNRNLIVSLAPGCLIRGTTKDGKNIILEKNRETGKIDLISAEWSEPGAMHLYAKGTNGNWEHHIEISGVPFDTAANTTNVSDIPNNRFILSSNRLDFLGRYRQLPSANITNPIVSTFLTLSPEMKTLYLDPSIAQVSLIGGAPDLTINSTVLADEDNRDNHANFSDVTILEYGYEQYARQLSQAISTGTEASQSSVNAGLTHSSFNRNGGAPSSLALAA